MKRQRSYRKVKTIAIKTVWVGFTDGQPDVRPIDTGWGGFGSSDEILNTVVLFPTKAKAGQQYRDVRKMQLREIVS